MGAGRFVLPATLAGVALGILAADVAPVPVGWALAAGGVLASLSALGRVAAGTVLGVAVIAVGLGGWRGTPSATSAQPDRPPLSVVVDGAAHELTGTIVDDPRPRADRLQLVIGDVRLERPNGPVALADRLLVWLPRGIDARSGDRLRLTSRVDLPEDFDGFAYREYLERQGVGGIARARSGEVVEEAGGLVSLLAGARGALLGGLNDLVPEPEAALGAGILLGVRTSMAPEVNDAFATAGLTHIVAVSGWNIAIVAAVVAALVRPLARRPGGRWTRAGVAAATVAAYVLLTGASPSVVRAALMAAAMLVARLGGSRAHASSALALAALLMLLAAPPVLWDVGFQLSLLATGGLIWFGAPIERRLAGWPAWIREPVALTMAAQLTTLPVILVNFERLSLVAPIANVLVVPFVPVAMLFSAIAAIAGMLTAIVDPPLVGTAVGWFAGGAAWIVLRTIIVLGSTIASVPHAALDVTIPPSLAVAWLPILALASWALREPVSGADRTGAEEERPSALASVARRALRPAPVLTGLGAILLAITLAGLPDGRLHVTVMDVGQGDAILVEAPGGATMLVDGGPDPELTLRRMGENLPFFARRIDLLVLSHPHQDHVAGLVDVLARFEVGAVLHAGIGFDNAANDRLLADALQAAVPVRLARSGQIVALDAVTSVEVLYPTESDAARPLPDGDINNGSVVLLVRHGGFAALLTGDAEAPVEMALLGRGLISRVDLLKVGHHGSHSSTTAGFLEAAQPSIAVISSGAGNEYGHPAAETLAALSGRPGLVVLRTDLDGDVEVASDGRTYRVRADRGWSAPRPVHGAGRAGSIGPWPSPTDPPRAGCSMTRACPTGSSSTPPGSRGLPSPPPGSWRRHGSRSTARSSKRRHCCTTSTRSRSGEPAERTASSGRVASRRWATRSSPCRSPRTRSPACSTTTAFRSAGHRSSSPSRTGMSPSGS